MKKLFYLGMICSLLVWTGCNNEDEKHLFTESYTDAAGLTYTKYHLEVKNPEIIPFLDSNRIDLELTNSTDDSTCEIFIERDEKRENCLVFYVPEGFKYKAGVYRTTLATRSGVAVTCPLEVECDNEQFLACGLSLDFFDYMSEFEYRGKEETAGTLLNPFLITDLEDLKKLRRCIELDKSRAKYRHFRQTKDITITVDSEADEGWRPIGYVKSNTAEFSGNYDGGDHTITGLSINNIDGNYLGLFSRVYYGSVKNLHLNSVTIKADESGSSYIGALCGESYDSTIDNVHVNSCVITGKKYLGGLIGDVSGSSHDNIQISNCSASILTIGDEDQSECVGGLIGSVVNLKDKIINCFTSGSCTLKARHAVGGLIGCAVNGYYLLELEDCTNRAELSGIEAVGGIVGESLVAVKFTRCQTVLPIGSNRNRVSLSGSRYVGGLVGYVSGADCSFIDCSSAAGIALKGGGAYIGGFVGYLKGNNILVRNSLCKKDGFIHFDGSFCGGVFGYVGGSTVTFESTDPRYASVNNASLNGTGDNVGGVVGAGAGNIMLLHVTSTGSVSAVGNNVGGLVGGIMEMKGSFTNITSSLRCEEVYLNETVTVEGSSCVGGFLGYIGTGRLNVHIINKVPGQPAFAGFVNHEANLTSPYCGGLVGYADHPYDIELTGLLVTGKVCGGNDVGGLFGKIDNGLTYTHITDCTVAGENGIHGINSVGGIAGSIISKGIKVRNCINQAFVNGSGVNLGGIVGYLNATSPHEEALIQSCTNKGNINGKGLVGGIVGQIDHPGSVVVNGSPSTFTVNYCTNEGTITGRTDVGGCIGSVENGGALLDQLSNIGTVTVNNGSQTTGGHNSAGGITGYASGNSIIQYSYNKGAVSGHNNMYVGGIAGFLKGTATASYNTGQVITDKGGITPHVGGIVGHIEGAGIFNCYNTRAVETAEGGDKTDSNGGIAGTRKDAKIQYCYYYGADMGTRAITRAGGTSKCYVLEPSDSRDGVGVLSAAKFQSAGNFTGWDFSSAGTWLYEDAFAGVRPVLRHNVEK